MDSHITVKQFAVAGIGGGGTAAASNDTAASNTTFHTAVTTEEVKVYYVEHEKGQKKIVSKGKKTSNGKNSNKGKKTSKGKKAIKNQNENIREFKMVPGKDMTPKAGWVRFKDKDGVIKEMRKCDIPINRGPPVPPKDYVGEVAAAKKAENVNVGNAGMGGNAAAAAGGKGKNIVTAQATGHGTQIHQPILIRHNQPGQPPVHHNAAFPHPGYVQGFQPGQHMGHGYVQPHNKVAFGGFQSGLQQTQASFVTNSCEPRIEPVIPPSTQPKAKPSNRHARGNVLYVVQTEKIDYPVEKVIVPPINNPNHQRMSDGVYAVRHPKTNELRVAKQIKTTTNQKAECAKSEADILQIVMDYGSHPNINMMYETFAGSEDRHRTLILEHCDAGSLEDFITTHIHQNTLVAEPFIWHVLSGMCAALAFLHSGVRDPVKHDARVMPWFSIAHLDIKPANVFLSTKPALGHEYDLFPRVVLGDLGCAVYAKDIGRDVFDIDCLPFGTHGWHPPEMQTVGNTRVGKYGKATDIWQMGGVAQCLGRLLQQPDMVLAIPRPFANITMGPRYSRELNYIVTRIMVANHYARPTAVDIGKEVALRVEKMGVKLTE